MVKFKTLFNNIDTEERISKRLARAGLCSRREAERLINAGRVSIDNEVINTPAINVSNKNLILVDTKYEFGKYDNEITLIDEIHTPDSSRYFYADSYQKLQDLGKSQKQLSKEFVREWLMENNFQGKEGQNIPEMTNNIVKSISERYIELYENIIGEKFIKRNTENMLNDIESNIKIALSNSFGFGGTNATLIFEKV